MLMQGTRTYANMQYNLLAQQRMSESKQQTVTRDIIIKYRLIHNTCLAYCLSYVSSSITIQKHELQWQGVRMNEFCDYMKQYQQLPQQCNLRTLLMFLKMTPVPVG